MSIPGNWKARDSSELIDNVAAALYDADHQIESKGLLSVSIVKKYTNTVIPMPVYSVRVKYRAEAPLFRRTVTVGRYFDMSDALTVTTYIGAMIEKERGKR